MCTDNSSPRPSRSRPSTSTRGAEAAAQTELSARPSQASHRPRVPDANVELQAGQQITRPGNGITTRFHGEASPQRNTGNGFLTGYEVAVQSRRRLNRQIGHESAPELRTRLNLGEAAEITSELNRALSLGPGRGDGPQSSSELPAQIGREADSRLGGAAYPYFGSGALHPPARGVGFALDSADRVISSDGRELQEGQSGRGAASRTARRAGPGSSNGLPRQPGRGDRSQLGRGAGPEFSNGLPQQPGRGAGSGSGRGSALQYVTDMAPRYGRELRDVHSGRGARVQSMDEIVSRYGMELHRLQSIIAAGSQSGTGAGLESSNGQPVQTSRRGTSLAGREAAEAELAALRDILPLMRAVSGMEGLPSSYHEQDIEQLQFIENRIALLLRELGQAPRV
jgi:hypothetical protein